MFTHLFAAANTQDGFFSLFDEYTSKTDHKIYLIKGGPGTGKSTFMKKVAAAAEQHGMDAELIHCSSDTDSLDGVYIPEAKMIFLDATAPHCVDPKYPAAVEVILPFGQFWNTEEIAEHSSEIIGLSDEISGQFAQIYQYLSAIGCIRRQMNQILEPAFSKEKATAQLSKIFRQQAFMPIGQSGTVSRRIISAPTKNGHKTFEDITRSCKRILRIEDSYDCASLYLSIADKMLEGLGYDRVQLLNPLNPADIDHIVIPSLDFAIVTENHRCHFEKDERTVKTISLKTALDKQALTEHKNRLNFGRKMCARLYEEVFAILAHEKDLHDELESYYIHAMDFGALEQFTEDFIGEHFA